MRLNPFRRRRPQVVEMAPNSQFYVYGEHPEFPGGGLFAAVRGMADAPGLPRFVYDEMRRTMVREASRVLCHQFDVDDVVWEVGHLVHEEAWQDDAEAMRVPDPDVILRK